MGFREGGRMLRAFGMSKGISGSFFVLRKFLRCDILFSSLIYRIYYQLGELEGYVADHR